MIEENEQILLRNIEEANVKMIGDLSTLNQVIQLLAYIRHAVNENTEDEIKVTIGKNISGSQFLFSVNNMEIPDFKVQKEISIN